MSNYKHLFIYLALFAFTFVSCEDNGAGDDSGILASLAVQQQSTVDGNEVVVSEVDIPEDGWVVIHRSSTSGDGPMVPQIIGKTELDAGVSSDVHIQLEASVADGEQLWAMVHQDTGTDGEYEFEGANSPDQPFTVNGDIVTESFMITQTNPSISAQDQTSENDEFTVSVDAAEDGWVVIHRSNDAGNGPMVPEIIAKTQVEAGSNAEVTIRLNDGEMVSAGETLWPMLHYDTGTDGEYEFTGSNSPDQPVIVDGDIVVTSFTVQQ